MYRNIDAEQARIGKTNAEMAVLLGISRSSYEKKKKTGMFSRPQIEMLIAIFSCEFGYLFERTQGNEEIAS